MVTMPDTWTTALVDTNYATNPGFETTAAPWTSAKPYATKTNVLSAMALDAAGAFTGSNGLKLTLGDTTSSSNMNWISYDNPVLPYATIQAKCTPAAGHSTIPGFWVLMPIQADGTVVPDAWGTYWAGGSGQFTVTTSWQQLSMMMSPAWLTNGEYPTMTGTRLFLQFGDADTFYGVAKNGDLVYLDMFANSNHNVSFDGFYPGTGTPSMDDEYLYEWTGAAYASTSTRTGRRRVHYPAVIVLGTSFLVEGTGYVPGDDVAVTEATWGEITEPAVVDAEGNWSVTMTIPANTDPDLGPVAGEGSVMVAATTGGYIYTNSPAMTYIDPVAGGGTVTARYFTGGSDIPITEIRIAADGALNKITELGI